MRILIVTDKMDIGGAETHILTLIEELARENKSITLASGGGVYAERLKALGIEVIEAPFDKRDPLSVFLCKRTLKDCMHRYDIVHTHTRFTSFLARAVRGKRLYPAIVTTAHLNFKIFPFGKLAFWGDGTLAVSEDIKDYLIKNYRLNSDNIAITRNSVNTEIYNKKREPKKLIIHTSRLDKGRAKTAFLLCECAEAILKKHPAFRILIVGDGNLMNKLAGAAKEANLKLGFEGVILMGARYDIPELLRYGTIFIGVSRSALEGMATGMPIIISGDEGYAGILSNENYSLLLKTNFCARGFDMPSEDKLIRDIDFLINNPKIANELSVFSKEIISNFFDARLMANDAMRCYLRTIKKPTLCLIGYFGYDNLGDEMILKTSLKALSERGISSYNLLTAGGKKGSLSKSDIRGNIKFYNRMDIRDIKRAILASDILVLCGGNLLQNETSNRSLIYYFEAIRYARKKGLRIYMLSAGFGGICGAFAARILKASLQLSDICGCRTNYDLKIAEKYCSWSKFMPDFCFLLDEANQDSYQKRFCWIVSKNKLIDISDIINISKTRELEAIAVILNYPEDGELCHALYEHNIRYSIPKDYEDFKAIVRGCAFTVSERLHGAIFSLMCHIPSYLTLDSPKKRALISDIKADLPSAQIILPYNHFDVCNKKEIGAQGSDFSYVIECRRREIKAALCEIFN